MFKKLVFLVALALLMYVAGHTYIIEDLLKIQNVGEIFHYWSVFLIVAVLLFKKK